MARKIAERPQPPFQSEAAEYQLYGRAGRAIGTDMQTVFKCETQRQEIRDQNEIFEKTISGG